MILAKYNNNNKKNSNNNSNNATHAEKILNNWTKRKKTSLVKVKKVFLNSLEVEFIVYYFCLARLCVRSCACLCRLCAKFFERKQKESNRIWKKKRSECEMNETKKEPQQN